MKRIVRWLDHNFFPLPDANEYMEDTLKTAKLELAKAYNDAEYANSVIAYRKAQIARIEATLTKSGTTYPTASAA